MCHSQQKQYGREDDHRTADVPHDGAEPHREVVLNGLRHNVINLLLSTVRKKSRTPDLIALGRGVLKDTKMSGCPEVEQQKISYKR